MRNYWFIKLVSIVLLLAAMLSVISCTTKTEPSGKIGVIVTILPQAEFVESVGGENVDITVMIPPGASPHTYAPTPGQLSAVKRGKIYATVGSGVEFELVYMDRIIAANKDMLYIDCSNGVELIDNDPHIWLSPKNAQIMVENICDGLVEVDPANKEYYVNRKQEYVSKLDALDREMETGLASITNRRFMVLHPAWGYLARDYDLEQIAIHIEGKNPSPHDLLNLIQKAKEYNIKVVFVSPQFNARSAETIALAIDGKVIPIDPLAEDYIDNMYQILDELVQGMN